MYKFLMQYTAGGVDYDGIRLKNQNGHNRVVHIIHPIGNYGYSSWYSGGTNGGAGLAKCNISADGSTYFNGGNVSIGTSSVGECTLHVSGDIKVTSGISFRTGNYNGLNNNCRT